MLEHIFLLLLLNVNILSGSANSEAKEFYSPSPLNVTIGTTVNWTNIDTAIHTVTSGDLQNQTGLFDSNIIFPQKSFTFLFNQTGNYGYYCTLHPFMKGVVTVK